MGRLSIDTLRRINTRWQVGDVDLADIARDYGLTPNALSCQLSDARRKGLLPKVKKGLPPRLGYYLNKVKNVPAGATFNPSDIGGCRGRNKKACKGI